MEPISIVVGIISAITTAYSAYEQSESQKEAAQQEKYDAEYEAEILKQQADAERMEREQARKSQARESEEARHRRIAYMTRAGGGIGVAGLQELSRQSGLDEVDVQNADARSRQRRKSMQIAQTNALLSGKMRSRSLRRQARTTFHTGQAGAAATGIGGFR